MTTTPRWDGDARGEGIGDGAWIAGDVRRLLATLDETNWIAEEPEKHLLPHLQHACAAEGSPWVLRSATPDGTVFVVSLDWSGNPARIGQVRADLFALLGSFAESATYVHQRVEDDAIFFDVVTGMLDEDMPFRPHGHLVQFRIGGDVIAAICAGRNPASQRS
jgi:hypothetical protein